MIVTKRTITVRGKPTTFSSRVLSNGQTAYYRSGQRAISEYELRVAKGILEGKTLAEASGRPFGEYSGKLLTKKQIAAEEEFHLGNWAEPPKGAGRGKEKATYYIKVSVDATTERFQRVGSPDGTEGQCTARTLKLRDPEINTQEGFTYKDLAKRFPTIALFTINSYGLTLCTGNLKNDLIAVWRHSRQ